MGTALKSFFASILLWVGFTSAAPALPIEAKGRLTAIFPEKREFLVEDQKGQQWTFYLDRYGKVFINNEEAKLEDLLPGEDVIVTYEWQIEKAVASELRCIRFAVILPREVELAGAAVIGR